MTALIAGVDFSSKAIHAALIPLDADHGSDCPAVTLRHYVLPVWRPASTTPQYRSVERCRLVRDAMRCLLKPHYSPATHDSYEAPLHVAHVCVEEPFGGGRKADNVMRELYGAILASIPSDIQRDTIGTQEWRRIAWGDDEVAPTHREITNGRTDWKWRAATRALDQTGVVMDEHEAESYLIATAARQRLDAAITRGAA